MTAYRRAKLLYQLQILAGGMVFGMAVIAVLILGLSLDALVVLK